MAKKEKQSFEASMKELENILEAMSDEQTTLDDSIALYAKAAQLLQDCNSALKNAQEQVDKIGLAVEEIGESNGL